MGKNNKSAVGTLVERHSRYVILLKLPNGHSAQAVRQAMTKRILTLPAQLRRSITWDQGKEMAQHVQFTLDTGVQIYFCDPKSPWQRGSNENANGLLRQYLPKSADLSQCTQRQLDAIALAQHATSTDPRLDDALTSARTPLRSPLEDTGLSGQVTIVDRIETSRKPVMGGS